MENKRKFRPDPELKLMDQVREVLRYHHYSYRTENTYCDWIVRYIKYGAHVKSPFYMDSGIKGFRNCELFKGITIITILGSGQITTFYETIIINNKRIEGG